MRGWDDGRDGLMESWVGGKESRWESGLKGGYFDGGRWVDGRVG